MTLQLMTPPPDPYAHPGVAVLRDAPRCQGCTLPKLPGRHDLTVSAPWPTSTLISELVALSAGTRAPRNRASCLPRAPAVFLSPGTELDVRN